MSFLGVLGSLDLPCGGGILKNMKEKFEEYRDEVADKLIETRRFGSAISPEKAREAKENAKTELESIKKSEEYQTAEAAHREKEKFLRLYKEKSKAEEIRNRESERELAKEIEQILSENAKESIKDRLRHLERAKDNYKDARTEPIEAACRGRFGLGWLEVRKQLFDKTSKPLQLLESPTVNDYPVYKDAFTVMPRDLVHAIPGTRSWMTDEFMETLDLLYASGEKHHPGNLKTLAKRFSDEVDKSRGRDFLGMHNAKEGQEAIDNRFIDYAEPIMANVIMPDKVKEVLAIHKDVFGDYKPPIEDHTY